MSRLSHMLFALTIAFFLTATFKAQAAPAVSLQTYGDLTITNATVTGDDTVSSTPLLPDIDLLQALGRANLTRVDSTAKGISTALDNFVLQ